MNIVLLSSDLMLAASAQGIADRHEAALSVTGSPDEAVRQCAAAPVAAVLIDLRLAGLNIGELAPLVRGQALGETVVVAFGPHVHTQSLAAAAEAGCDAVLTRGEFERRVDALLAKLQGA